MLNGEKMLKDGEQCNLHIVKDERLETQDGLYPNRTAMGSLLSTHSTSSFCILLPRQRILGELGYMSIGVGYTIPFQMFAAPWMEAEKLAGNLNRLNVPGSSSDRCT